MAKLEMGPIPLYFQLEQKLRDQIKAGTYDPDTPMPSEEQLCADYGVSRITVRKAFDALIQQGLIIRRRGVGTFVTQGGGDEKNTRLVGSIDGLLSYTKHLSYDVLGLNSGKAPARIDALLGLDGTEAVHLELVGLLDDAPFAYSNFYFPPDVGRTLSADDLVEGTPVIRMVERKAGERVVRAEQTIEPVAAGKVGARHLGLDETTPLLLVTRTYFTGAGRALEVASIRYHPDRYKYFVELVNAGA